MEILHKYTDLACLMHILNSKRIYLLNPNRWDDKNDSHFMEQYKLKKEAKTVLASCFSQSAQTYHHWSIFSRGSSGVCVSFHKEKLIEHFLSEKSDDMDFWGENAFYSYGDVKYLNQSEIKNLAEKRNLDCLPYYKRKPYEAESEYRFLYLNFDTIMESKGVSVDISSIERVTLSPWMPKNFRESVKKTIKKISGCQNLNVYSSTIVNNEVWKEYANKF